MRFRNLRIAWSVGWALAAVLLIALWVRSYSRAETIARINDSGVRTLIVSEHGTLIFKRTDLNRVPRFSKPEPQPWTYEVSRPQPLRNTARFTFQWTESQLQLIVADWLLLLVCVVAGAGVWTRWSIQFSVRTLLIATALIAIVLGVIVGLR